MSRCPTRHSRVVWTSPVKPVGEKRREQGGLLMHERVTAFSITASVACGYRSSRAVASMYPTLESRRPAAIRVGAEKVPAVIDSIAWVSSARTSMTLSCPRITSTFVPLAGSVPETRCSILAAEPG
jgi:hypothetical protein